jgi:uncharacterized small protein (DUF1192 family)
MTQELNTLHHFELGDRINCIIAIIESSICEHPALSENATEVIEEVQRMLYDIYNQTMMTYHNKSSVDDKLLGDQEIIKRIAALEKEITNLKTKSPTFVNTPTPYYPQYVGPSPPQYYLNGDLFCKGTMSSKSY